MRECRMLNFTVTTSTSLERSAKASRPAGVLYSSSAGPVVDRRRLAWSKEVNKRLFKCYIKSEPERTGHRKRLLDLWKTRKTNDEVTEVTEKRLADQVRQIKDKKWLANVKQEEIALRVNIEHQQVETTEPSTTDTLYHVARTPDIQEEKC